MKTERKKKKKKKKKKEKRNREEMGQHSGSTAGETGHGRYNDSTSSSTLNEAGYRQYQTYVNKVFSSTAEKEHGRYDDSDSSSASNETSYIQYQAYIDSTYDRENHSMIVETKYLDSASSWSSDGSNFSGLE